MLKETVALTLGVSKKVLILILMEHAQRAVFYLRISTWSKTSLNSYFNGTCSKSQLVSYTLENCILKS